jgi:hypothetical protein
MVGHYLGEFSVSYKPVKHGRPGVRPFLLLLFVADHTAIDWCHTL